MRLEQGESDHELMRQEMLGELVGAEADIFERMQVMQSEMDVILERFTSCLSADFRGKTMKQGISDHLKRLDELAAKELLQVEAAATVDVVDETQEQGEGGAEEEFGEVE